MKKISKGYYIASAPLLIWAIADFYHYFTVGKNLLEHYSGEGIIQSLVNGSLAGGLIKIGLVLLIFFAGWYRARYKRASFRSMTAVTLLLVTSIIGTWLTSMVCLTVVTAQEIYDQLYEASYNFPEEVDKSSSLGEFYDQSSGRYGLQFERGDFFEYRMIEGISHSAQSGIDSDGNYGGYYSERSKLIRSIRYPMETAVLFYDGEGNLLHSSDDDVMYFDYFTQEEWDAGRDSASGLHYGWIDISEGKNADNWQDDPYLRFRTMFAGTHNLMDIAVIRVDGYFEENELKPVVMHFITDTLVHQVVESTNQFSTGENSYAYILSDVDRTGKLEWQLQFDHSAEYKGKELVTVYITYPEMWDYQDNPLVYGGEEYENLAILTETLDFPSWSDISLYSVDFRGMGRFKLNELLIFSGWSYADYEGFDYSSGGEPEPEYMLVTAVRSKPLSYAIKALRNIYILTGILAFMLLMITRNRIKKHLIQPVANIADAMEEGWRNIFYPENSPSVWLEAEMLQRGFSSEKDRRRMQDNEITRLNTALEYAKTAEQTRRQMTSNIAHELKTPLAVIHSYAEGLKEHIAEDKRDKYVDVILSETQRTDSMVLEMLDLSRLEAGKVKLSRDEFSLADLAKAIFEKLEMAAQAKNLQIDYDFPSQSIVVADENRIAQVIENFATNAVKYTPAGGHVAVKIRNNRSGVSFSIENDSEPLSIEALSKVWDTFYRTDESRSGGGTGLGLAIAKNIVELHGGKCSVKNTKNGVEFSFTI